jgi:hypothetical protein
MGQATLVKLLTPGHREVNSNTVRRHDSSPTNLSFRAPGQLSGAYGLS